MRLLVAIVGAVLIVGCAPKYRYTHPNFSEQQWKKDRYQCEQEVAYYYGDSAHYDTLFGSPRLRQCLEARGYSAVSR